MVLVPISMFILFIKAIFYIPFHQNEWPYFLTVVIIYILYYIIFFYTQDNRFTIHLYYLNEKKSFIARNRDQIITTLIGAIIGGIIVGIIMLYLQYKTNIFVSP